MDEATLTGGPPSPTSIEWRLQFDGACRDGPNPGGAGALLYGPDGAAVWTRSCFMPGATETNNTAEYTALLIGVRVAADHGARQLRIEGDSLLVIRQVKGLYATKSTRLRRLRNAVLHELDRLEQYTLHHIDRQGNAFADRLQPRPGP
jgi:ribonuclease HI